MILKTRHNNYFPNAIAEFCLQYVFYKNPFCGKHEIKCFKVKCKIVYNLDMFEIE